MNKLLIALLLAAPLTLNAAEAPVIYSKEVMNRVMSSVIYPKMARMRKQEGVVALKITVDPKGGAVGEVETSSGFESLDQAALTAVKLVGPLPNPPEPNVVVRGTVRFTAE